MVRGGERQAQAAQHKFTNAQFEFELRRPQIRPQASGRESSSQRFLSGSLFMQQYYKENCSEEQHDYGTKYM